MLRVWTGFRNTWRSTLWIGRAFDSLSASDLDPRQHPPNL